MLKNSCEVKSISRFFPVFHAKDGNKISVLYLGENIMDEFRFKIGDNAFATDVRKLYRKGNKSFAVKFELKIFPLPVSEFEGWLLNNADMDTYQFSLNVRSAIIEKLNVPVLSNIFLFG